MKAIQDMSIPQHQHLLSIVIPCYNEEEVIEQTHRSLVEALAQLDLELEIIYVDDGSRDTTQAKLRRIQAQDPRVQVLVFARNFGHQVAVTAGIDHAQGDAVVLIDADLQDPPELIPEMVRRWRAGFDVVYAQRTQRLGETALRLAATKLFYRLLNWCSDTEIPLDTGDFRLMSRAVVDALGQMPEHDRFLRGMISWVGFQQTALLYQRAPRFAGVSKYPFRKLLALAADGILSFSVKPLRLATALGLLTTTLALVGIVTTTVLGWSSLATDTLATLMFFAIVFLGGIQLICTGILGEYMGRIYRESKRRPLYLIRDHIGQQHDGRTLSTRQPGTLRAA